MKKYDIFLEKIREYEICLPDRMKEGFIIVQSMRLHDHISAVNSFFVRINHLRCNLKKFTAAISRSGISAQIIHAPLKKTLRYDHQVGIDTDIPGTVISNTSAESAVQFSSSVSAGIRRYRMVSEVADLSTLDTGAMTLQDFFFVTIE